jgi:hypothetical protein
MWHFGTKEREKNEKKLSLKSVAEESINLEEECNEKLYEWKCICVREHVDCYENFEISKNVPQLRYL